MYFDSRTRSIERSPRNRNVIKKYRCIILHPWGKGINFPIKVRMRTALTNKCYYYYTEILSTITKNVSSNNAFDGSRL